MPETPLEQTRTFNAHRMTSPYNLEIEQERSNAVIYGFFGLTALAAVRTELDEVDYELAGFSDPYCYVEIETGGELYTLTIGDICYDGVNRYCTSNVTGDDIAYIFSPDSLPWLKADPKNLMAEVFLTPYVYSLKELIIEAGGPEINKRIEFEITGDPENHSFSANGQKITDESRFTSMYMFIISARGDVIFTEDCDSELLARVTFKYRDGARTDDVVEYYASGDRKSVIRVNGENVFKCRDVYTTRLIANTEAFLSGGEIFYDW